MADFCNQCAKEFSFPEGDFARPNMSPPEEGMGYPELCEGCGSCYVDEKGNCNDPCCDRSHGCLAKAEEILKEFARRFEVRGAELQGFGVTMLLDEVATELCGERYTYELVQQIHDDYVVKVSFKPQEATCEVS